MLLFLGISTLLMAAFLFCVIYVEQKDNDETALIAFLGGIFVIFTILGIYCIGEHFYPSIRPMDVYRGRTTLEITYKDSVAIDSVVVWKEE